MKILEYFEFVVKKKFIITNIVGIKDDILNNDG